MPIVRYSIKIYKAANGKRPFEVWFNDLADKKAQIAIDMRLERVKMCNFGQCKSLGGQIYELKIDIGPGYRVYFGKIRYQIILLLCAGNKKTQIKDIARAKTYFQEFKKSEE